MCIIYAYMYAHTQQCAPSNKDIKDFTHTQTDTHPPTHTHTHRQQCAPPSNKDIKDFCAAIRSAAGRNPVVCVCVRARARVRTCARVRVVRLQLSHPMTLAPPAPQTPVLDSARLDSTQFGPARYGTARHALVRSQPLSSYPCSAPLRPFASAWLPFSTINPWGVPASLSLCQSARSVQDEGGVYRDV